eukprot:g34399.t1
MLVQRRCSPLATVDNATFPQATDRTDGTVTVAPRLRIILLSVHSTTLEQFASLLKTQLFCQCTAQDYKSVGLGRTVEVLNGPGLPSRQSLIKTSNQDMCDTSKGFTSSNTVNACTRFNNII